MEVVQAEGAGLAIQDLRPRLREEYSGFQPFSSRPWSVVVRDWNGDLLAEI